ncbi:hypothetical protein CC2G_002865 [Coprinopsis cinerea AmutBmut pab1-1]|nr:hypothetical protein CC2G_002865 [Coprinopsis cinerea AmutBmut pab1-1]
MSLESLDEEIKGNNLPKTNPPLPPTLLDGLAARGPIWSPWNQEQPAKNPLKSPMELHDGKSEGYL